MITCKACGALTQTYLCPACIDLLRTHLARYIEVEPDITRALTQPPRLSEGPKVSTSKTADPFRPAVLEMKTAIEDTITTWASALGSEATSARGHAAWLLTNAEEIARCREDAAQLLEEIAHVTSRLTERILSPSRQRPPSGVCPLCGAATVAKTIDDTRIHVCTTCGTTTSDTDMRSTWQSKADGLWLSPADMARYISHATGQRVGADQIYYYRRAGYLQQTTDGHVHAKDVINLLRIIGDSS